ncbi:MAG: hypothetical protein ACXQTP_03325 [Candidatus Methanofastidiosia archaeon]
MKEKDLFELLEKKGFEKKEIPFMIEEKRKKMGDRLTDEGIFSLIASEHDIESEEEKTHLKIDKITPGLTNINLVVRVLRIFDEKDFETNDGRKGKLQNLLVGDTTGKIHITLWDREVNVYKNKIHNGDVVRIVNGISRQGPTGPQIGLGLRGKIIIEDEKEFKDIVYTRQTPIKRKSISDVLPGERFIEIRATVSNIYRMIVYNACPRCQKRVIKTKDAFFCENCKTSTSPKKTMVIEIGIDDGSGHIRAIFFGDSAAELIDESPENVSRNLQEYLDAGYNPKNAGFEYLLENKIEILGKEILVTGHVVENEFLGAVLNVSDVQNVDIEREIEKKLEILESEFSE